MALQNNLMNECMCRGQVTIAAPSHMLLKGLDEFVYGLSSLYPKENFSGYFFYSYLFSDLNREIIERKKLW
jgi:hypothetical protein